jgi:hypothetical protein
LASEPVKNDNTLLTNRFIHTWIHLGFSQIDDDLETDNFVHILPIQGDEHNGEDLFYYSGYNYLISSVDDDVEKISININAEDEDCLYIWLETAATDIKAKERPLKLSGFNFFYPMDSLTVSDIEKKHLELIKLNFYKTQGLWSLIESNWTDTILRFDEYLDNNGNRNRIVNYLNTIDDKHEMLYAFNSYLTYKSLIFSLCSDEIDYNSNSYLNNKLKKYLKDYAKDTFSITERYHLYKAFKEVDDLFDMVNKTQVNTRKIPKGKMSEEEHKILKKEREKHNKIYEEHEKREKALEDFIEKTHYLKNIEISLIDIDEQDKAKRNLNRRVGQQVINVLRSNSKKQLSGSKILDIFKKQHRRKLDFPSS